MQSKNILATGILALAGLVLVARPAQAVTYVDGDLILGFRATGGTGSSNSYEVDLGSVAQFDTGGVFATGAPILLSYLGDLGADLSDASKLFGSTWNIRADVLWSISGVHRTTSNAPAGVYPTNTLFATDQESPLGTNTPQVRRSVSNSSGIALKMSALGTQYAFGDTNTNGGGLANGDQVTSTNSPFALIQPNALSPQGYRNNMPGGSNSGATSSYSSFVTPAIEGDFTNGTAGSVLDLWKLIPGSGNGSLMGTFQMNDSGGVTYTASAAPEPTSFALLALGAGLLGAVRRRRVNA